MNIDKLAAWAFHLTRPWAPLNPPNSAQHSNPHLQAILGQLVGVGRGHHHITLDGGVHHLRTEKWNNG